MNHALILTLFLAQADVKFVDATAEAGLTYMQQTPLDFCSYISGPLCEAEKMSGGAAVADVNGDGFPDLYVTRYDQRDILFQNTGAGTFVDVTDAAGLGPYDLNANGVAFGDVDNDGDQDLYVTVIGEILDRSNSHFYLFLNDGTGTFVEESFQRGLGELDPGALNGYSAVFGDFDRDGWIDLHVNQWFPSGPLPRTKLMRNRGLTDPGVFDDWTAPGELNFWGMFAFASAFVDLDRDGWQDIAIAADFGTSRLFWNDGDTTFTQAPMSSGIGTDENGMGSAFADYDLDGDLDWFVTSISDPLGTCTSSSAPCNWGNTGNRLYRNDGGRQFTDVTDAAGVRQGGWGWGAVFFDFDNDGDEDLVQTNGVKFYGTSFEDPFEQDPMRLWQNDAQGSFDEVSAQRGLVDLGSGKGLLTFDFDLDGDLDVFVVNNAAEARLFRNDGGNQNHWLRVRVHGTVSNRDGLGAHVIVRRTPNSPRMIREIGVNGHFLAQSEREAHFGLGPSREEVHEVRVVFPASGVVRTYHAVKPNQTLVVVE